jgi:L-histidine N-alpha-methyltransferase
MHLVSREAQTISIDSLDLAVAFAKGESIHTENSYKYDDSTLQDLAAAAGFAIERRWTDGNEWFADLLLVAR